MSRLPHLLSPGRIGAMTMRNRIVVTAMGASLAEPDGHCGERIVAYHEEQAKGGAGLIVTGVAGVAWPIGGNQVNQIAISDDKFLPGLRRLTEAAHRHGAKIAPQLHHGGMVAMEDALAGRPMWCPSPPDPPSGDFTAAFLLEEIAAAPFGRIRDVRLKIMTEADIAELVGQFAAAADRARRAGFDGVEIHGGHGYILSAFLSPKSNKRTDAYGGSLENRARLLLEVIGAVRAAVGTDFPVWCKLDSREVGKPGGITVEDAIAAARLAEAAGVDAITVSAYHDTGKGKNHSASNIPHEPGANLPAAAVIKAALRVPVIASGRVEPELGDRTIAAGGADFIAMGRKLLADPHLPNKLVAGRAAAVRPCIYCYTCVSAIYTCEPMRCAVRAETGFEHLETPRKRGPSKRVVVIGGGPGGMEAARRLDGAGHRVTLFEAGERLGGTLRFASLAYPANERLLDWLRRGIAGSGVEVRTNTRATREAIAALRPDAVVVATGAVRAMPALPGADLPHVFSGDDMRALMLGERSVDLRRKVGPLARAATRFGALTGLTANLDFVRAASRAWMPLSRRVVIVGGELVGLELAEFLAERHREVSVVDEAPRLGAGLTVVRRMRLLDELPEHGVALFAGASAIRIEAHAVRFTDRDGDARAIPAGTVIVAQGAHGDTRLVDELECAGMKVYPIGDCLGVGYIEGAMRGAAEAAKAIDAL